MDRPIIIGVTTREELTTHADININTVAAPHGNAALDEQSLDAAIKDLHQEIRETQHGTLQARR